MAERSATAIRFPVEGLRQASAAHGLTINYLVVKAVEEFLAKLLPPQDVRLTRQVPASPAWPPPGGLSR